jgi:hypothetical protein
MHNIGNIHLVAASSRIEASQCHALKQALAPRSGHPSRPAAGVLMFPRSVARLEIRTQTAAPDQTAYAIVHVSKHCGIMQKRALISTCLKGTMASSCDLSTPSCAIAPTDFVSWQRADHQCSCALAPRSLVSPAQGAAK